MRSDQYVGNCGTGVGPDPVDAEGIPAREILLDRSDDCPVDVVWKRRAQLLDHDRAGLVLAGHVKKPGQPCRQNAGINGIKPMGIRRNQQCAGVAEVVS